MKTKKKVIPLKGRPRRVYAKTSSKSRVTTTKKRIVKHARPLHKRVLLHPVNFFFLLCIGVFLVGLTIHVFAETIAVKGSVFAPLPTTTPDITWPADQTHFNLIPVSITGACEPNSYVKLMRNNLESGIASCGPGSNTYSIETDLLVGTNDIYARIFNATNNEGPASSHITIYYDVLDESPALLPIVLPTTLQLLTTEDDTYRSGNIPVVSPYPTLSGIAPPRSFITITYHSKIIACTTYADNQGSWTCSLDERLTDGLHEVYITALTPEGKTLTLPMFQVRVLSSITPLHHPMAGVTLFSINAAHQDVVYASGVEQSWDVNITGGTSPYAFNVLWGDGKKATIARNDRSNFFIKHSFQLGGIAIHAYTIKIEAVDIKGLRTTLQLASLVRGEALSSGATVSSSTNPTLNSKIKQWMWVLWPSYLIVSLMTVSFWLGERQERANLRSVRKHTRRHA